MPLFGRRKTPPPAPWAPTVDLATARPAVFALANAPASSDSEVRAAIAEFVRLSERPPVERAVHLIVSDPDVLHRPWIWLVAVMQAAADAGDHHLPAAALVWACHWTAELVPRGNLRMFLELELDPIPPPWKAKIASVGVSSARLLGQGFVVVGDDTGTVHAGPLADHAAALLGA